MHPTPAISDGLEQHLNEVKEALPITRDHHVHSVPKLVGALALGRLKTFGSKKRLVVFATIAGGDFDRRPKLLSQDLKLLYEFRRDDLDFALPAVTLKLGGAKVFRYVLGGILSMPEDLALNEPKQRASTSLHQTRLDYRRAIHG